MTGLTMLFWGKTLETLELETPLVLEAPWGNSLEAGREDAGGTQVVEAWPVVSEGSKRSTGLLRF